MNDNKLRRGMDETDIEAAFSDADEWVKKSGDTMTGPLNINAGEGLHLQGTLWTPYIGNKVTRQMLAWATFEINTYGEVDKYAGLWVWDNQEDRDSFQWQKGSVLRFPKPQMGLFTWNLPKRSGTLMSNEGCISGSNHTEFFFDVGRNSAEQQSFILNTTPNDLVIVTGVYVAASAAEKGITVNSWKLSQKDTQTDIEVVLSAFMITEKLQVTGTVDYVILKNAR